MPVFFDVGEDHGFECDIRASFKNFMKGLEMKVKMWASACFGALVCVLAPQVHADLLITEVMSSSGAGGT